MAFVCRRRCWKTNFKHGWTATQSRHGTYLVGRPDSQRKSRTICLSRLTVSGEVTSYSAARPSSTPTTNPYPSLSCSTNVAGFPYVRRRPSVSAASRTTPRASTLPAPSPLRRIRRSAYQLGPPPEFHIWVPPSVKTCVVWRT